ncbi:MAG: hypothetical protein ACJ764_11235 [Solirubrobacteraceae bacterium]
MPRLRMWWLGAGALVLTVGAAALVAGQSSAFIRLSRAAGSCPRPTIGVPPNEPVYSSGSTGLVSGLYVQGGAVPPPPCKPRPRGPYAGTIKVTNRRTGAVVARRAVRNGHLAHLRLAPGTYNLVGHFSSGYTSNPVKLRIRQGERTRQDVFEDVP